MIKRLSTLIACRSITFARPGFQPDSAAAREIHTGDRAIIVFLTLAAAILPQMSESA